jgi:predicted signal transduction protein with EAL and GGDEF domain
MLVLTTPRLYLRWYQSCWASHSTRRCAATCEEIIAILVGSDRAEAACSAEGVRRALTDLGIAHSASGTRAYVTVSTGVTTVEPGGDYSHERAVRLADVALYATKARGRDGWSFHAPEDEAAGAALGERQPPDAPRADRFPKTAS